MWGPDHFLYACSPEHTVKPFMGAESPCSTLQGGWGLPCPSTTLHHPLLLAEV